MNFPDPAIIHEAMILMKLKEKTENDDIRNTMEDRIRFLCEEFAKELMNAKQ